MGDYGKYTLELAASWSIDGTNIVMDEIFLSLVDRPSVFDINYKRKGRT